MPWSAFCGRLAPRSPFLKYGSAERMCLSGAWEANRHYPGLQKIFTEGEAFHPPRQMELPDVELVFQRNDVGGVVVVPVAEPQGEGGLIVDIAPLGVFNGSIVPDQIFPVNV